MHARWSCENTAAAAAVVAAAIAVASAADADVRAQRHQHTSTTHHRTGTYSARIMMMIAVVHECGVNGALKKTV